MDSFRCIVHTVSAVAVPLHNACIQCTRILCRTPHRGSYIGKSIRIQTERLILYQYITKQSMPLQMFFLKRHWLFCHTTYSPKFFANIFKKHTKNTVEEGLLFKFLLKEHGKQNHQTPPSSASWIHLLLSKRRSLYNQLKDKKNSSPSWRRGSTRRGREFERIHKQKVSVPSRL